MVTFELSVEGDLTDAEAQQVLDDFEEVLGKHSLSLNDSDFYNEEEE